MRRIGGNRVGGRVDRPGAHIVCADELTNQPNNRPIGQLKPKTLKGQPTNPLAVKPADPHPHGSNDLPAGRPNQLTTPPIGQSTNRPTILSCVVADRLARYMQALKP